VIIVDANILLYAYDLNSPYHARASEWLDGAMDRREELGFAWVTLMAFLRIGTSRFFTEISMTSACEVIERLTWESNVEIVAPTAKHWPIFKDLLLHSQLSPNMVTDAHLAALAIEHNAVLCTNDRDFTRFAGLKLMNPVETH
jgi:uncharacterized protein